MLADLEAYGPYASLVVADGDGWVPFPGDLDAIAGAYEAALAERFGHPVEERVAASTAHLALVARVVAPALLLEGLTGLVPDLSPANLRWRPRLGGPAPLAVVDATPSGTGLDETLDALGGLVRSPAVRAGNVASAVATAGRLYAPATAPATAWLAAHGCPAPQRFRRDSCCLYYRADPRAGLCGDCVLT